MNKSVFFFIGRSCFLTGLLQVKQTDFEKKWAVCYGDWKLINNVIDVLLNDKNKVLEGLYLTNLNENPSESENLKDKYPAKVKELLMLRKQS